jgi:glycerol-3-phosphate dehydrogenase (NAD(P)+)
MIIGHVAVLGAGAWGSALANLAAQAGHSVTLWARDANKAAAIEKRRENPRLPGMRLDDRITVTGALSCAMEADVILLVVPAQSLRSVAAELRSLKGVPVIACAKGIEHGTHKFMTEVIADVAPGVTAGILSGPSFAVDVARGLPAAVTLAAKDESVAENLARALSTPTFRLYHSIDMRGVEIGGAAKNVLAIAAGIVVGRGLGASAAAALTTRGFAELSRFGRALGAKPETLTGLSGLGDLILTCSSPQSRNYSLGVALGQGKTDALHGDKLVEGATTAPVLVEMAKEKNIDMPIASAVAAVLGNTLSVDQAAESLLTRPLRAEH